MHGMMGDWGAWGWGMGLGWIFMALFWVLIIFGIVALAKWIISGGGWGRSGKGPLEILQERYARGEITREQYEQMRHDLLSSR
jgi:putative membrane protein